MHTGSLRTATGVLVAALAAGCGVKTERNGPVKITSVTPDTASITGGIEIQLGGKGFDDGSGPPTVVFGASQAQVVSYSNNSIQVILPAGLSCGAVDLQVNNAKGYDYESRGFTYIGGNNLLTVSSISPALGDIAGGTEVMIEGEGFTGGVGVALNGVPLHQIEILSDTQIRARTPPMTAGGVANLSLRNCADEATLSDAFLFTTELNGVIVELPWVDYVNPAQFTGAQDYIDPFVAFVEPSPDSLLNPIPTLDACRFNPPDPGAGQFTIIDAGSTVSLASGAQTITLSKQPDDLYYYPLSDSTAFQTGKFIPGAGYSFSASGNAVLPPFSAPNAFAVPADFAVSAPNIGTPTPTTVPRSQLQFTWNATAPGDLFEIILIGFDNQANETNQVLECFVNDDGGYLVSNSDMGKFTTATTQLLVYAIRRKDTGFIVPANGSHGTGVGMIYKVGVLYFP